MNNYLEPVNTYFQVNHDIQITETMKYVACAFVGSVVKIIK
jgi:hypothetical protein